MFPQPSHLPQCRKQCGEKGEGVMSTPLPGLVLDLCSQQGEGGGGCNRPGRPVHGLTLFTG